VSTFNHGNVDILDLGPTSHSDPQGVFRCQ